MDKMDSEFEARQAELRVAITVIGIQLGYKIWTARNEESASDSQREAGEIGAVCAELEGEEPGARHAEVVSAVQPIDCIWFGNPKFPSIVIKIEQTTGITSGLTTMKNLQDSLPLSSTRWVLAAPDDARNNVLSEANKLVFRNLRTRFFPKSAVDDLHSLCKRRGISQRHVKEQFLDDFMEQCISD